ncbi:MAG: tryptophan 7-halogenase, partial [Bacteroidota bacterium]|nr:tryptophan 7-halogenase [Bacteroidota bacterium]
KNLGVLEQLKKISPRKPGVDFVNRDGKLHSLWCFKNVVKDEKYLSFHVKRSDFDDLLLKNSSKNGVSVLEETAVKSVTLDMPDGTIEVFAENMGQKKTFHAKFIIDASGQSTFLGNKLGVKKSYNALDRVAFFTHWSNSTFDTQLNQGVIKIVYLGEEEDKLGWSWVIPISADNLSIGIVVNNSFVKKQKEKFIKAGSENWKHDLYMEEIKNAAAIQGLLGSASVCHKVQVIGDYSYYCEKKYGDNYAIIGDAGAFLDPIFSSGIYVGMHSAELLANALDKKFKTGDSKEMDQAFELIGGALKVLEKFIRLFYSPGNMNFATAGNPSELMKFKQTESIYSIFHFLLAGDFFENHHKYNEFLDTMLDPKNIGKFSNLIKHTHAESPDADCGEKFEEMYGRVMNEIQFNLSELS